MFGRKKLKQAQVPQEVNLPPPPRPTSEIYQEYSRVAAQAGNLQYQIHTFEKELDGINDVMRRLNFEAAAAQAVEKAAADKAAHESSQPEGVSSNA